MENDHQRPDEQGNVFALPLNSRAEESFTLPSNMYTDQAVYDLEVDRIFHRTWQYVAHTTMFRNPGDYVAFRLAGQNIFAILGDDGQIRAFHNVCRHRAHELLPEGVGNVERVIVCPYHAWTYARDGRLRGAPGTNSRPGFDTSDFPLSPVRSEIFLDCVFINLDAGSQALSEIAGDLEEDVRRTLPFYGRLAHASFEDQGETSINAGWKVVVDNYVECYHCDHAHPDFSDIICMDSYRHEVFGMWAKQLGGKVKVANSAYPLDPSRDFMQSAFWYLWPNTTINVMPGKEEVNFSAIRPAGLEWTRFEGHTISVTENVDEVRMNYSANVLIPEDIRLCESVQRGLKSLGYSQGPFVAGTGLTGRGEHAVHHFHRLVQQALAG